MVQTAIEANSQELSGVRPIRLLELELSEPLPFIYPKDTNTELLYSRARVLVRLHHYPLGFFDMELPAEGLPPSAYCDQLWHEFQQAANEHLHQDKLPASDHLDTGGLLNDNIPSCREQRQHLLENAPFISVVVSTRDRTQEITKTLPAMLKINYPNYEIIVVDNASKTTAVADLLRDQYQANPKVRYFREDRPGLSWGRNCGLRHAQGEIVAFIDDDELPNPDWLTELALSFKALDNVACVTGMTFAAELETPAQLLLEEFGGFCKGRGFKQMLFNLTTHRQPEPLYPYLTSKFGAGGNMAFKTAVLRQLNGFDPSLGAGTPSGASEETEVFFRLIMQGYTLVSEPAAIVRHYHRREYSGLRQQLYSYGLGFTSYLTKTLLDDPRRLLFLLGKTPYALNYLFNPNSVRNKQKTVTYPSELTNAELKGMLYGPLAYLRSRWRTRKLVAKFGQLDVGKIEGTYLS
jgi:GT2 family glycosyltransferase